MSFFSKITRALGFDGDNDDFREELDEVDVATPDAVAPTEPVAASEVPELTEVPVLPSIDPDMKARIFDGVLEIFNRSLPDFIARSIDPAAQRKQMADALDKSVDEYLNSLMLTAEQYAENKLKVAMENSQREAERLKNDMAQLEHQRASLRESQLSADRRRRALADRVNDLEGRVAKAEAEREQFELENKSLLNKLKVADVQPGLVDDMAREIESLKAALADAGGQPAADNGAAAEVERLTKLVADMEQQQVMAQGMYNDMQEKLAAERDARVAAEALVQEANATLDELSAVQSQIEHFDEVIRKRDERIEKLKASNKRLRDENENLRQRLSDSSNNLFAPVPDDKEPAPVAPEVVSEYAAIEDDFECPDWFVAEPGPGLVPLHTDDPNFGYQEPAHKPRKPESDAQLSLF